MYRHCVVEFSSYTQKQIILDENEYQEYKKAYRVFDSAVCRALKKSNKRRFGDTLQLFQKLTGVLK